MAGGVFAPVPKKLTRPAYSYGPTWEGAIRKPMYQCPVSAIPAEVFDLLWLWWDCRMLRTLPRAGGLGDQPQIVRMAFSVFENEMRAVDEQANAARQQTAAAAAALAGVAGVMGGRK